MPLSIVIGVPGVGKSTVMEELKKIGDGKVKVIVFGDYMFDIAKKEGLVKHRDEMRTLPVEVQRRLQEEASKMIYEESSKFNGMVLLDTHGFIKTPNGFLPGLPEHILRILRPDFTILIEADPSLIAARRSRDETRIRDPDMEEMISLHQMMNRMAAATYSTITGCNIIIVKNEEGKAHEAAKKLAESLGVGG